MEFIVNCRTYNGQKLLQKDKVMVSVVINIHSHTSLVWPNPFSFFAGHLLIKDQKHLFQKGLESLQWG